MGLKGEGLGWGNLVFGAEIGGEEESAYGWGGIRDGGKTNMMIFDRNVGE